MVAICDFLSRNVLANISANRRESLKLIIIQLTSMIAAYLIGLTVSLLSVVLLVGINSGLTPPFNLKVAWADQITGTDGNDNLVGTVKADTIDGLAGDDSIDSKGGKDQINGNRGDDTLHGGKSRDIIKGGPGNDKLFGEGSNDKLYGGSGDDDLKGGAGADYFDCGKGVDEIIDFNPVQGDTKAGNCEDF
ncbi:MAG TPA: calcium-binding protein [Nitrososphaeraceae archaeon]